MAVCFTHPLDLIKVLLQTQQQKDMTVIQIVTRVVKTQGVLGLYNGLSASILRQMTYSLTRFAIYETTKNTMGETSFLTKVGIASGAGAAGGFVGTPGDLVNVRMQNDMKLPPNQRRNYRHAIDGVWRVVTEEGFTRLFSGATMATCRAVFMTVGQIAFYDQTKYLLIHYTSHFQDNLVTHFTASLIAGAIATTLTQPLDVLKTRAMNAKPGEYRNLWHIITYTGRMGPQGFFKGYVPAFLRLAPQTILTFVFFEQLRLNFGEIVSK